MIFAAYLSGVGPIARMMVQKFQVPSTQISVYLSYQDTTNFGIEFKSLGGFGETDGWGGSRENSWGTGYLGSVKEMCL